MAGLRTVAMRVGSATRMPDRLRARMYRDCIRCGRITRMHWSHLTGRCRSDFEATPILFRETLYLTTPFDRIIALDPETGAERWTYDPGLSDKVAATNYTSRGGRRALCQYQSFCLRDQTCAATFYSTAARTDQRDMDGARPNCLDPQPYWIGSATQVPACSDGDRVGCSAALDGEHIR